MAIPDTLTIRAQGDREVVMTRTFDAPRDKVFEAWTRPDLLRQWLGIQNRWTMDVCDVDLQVDGAYRFVWKNPDGSQLGVRGTYREVQPPQRLVTTELFDEAWYPGEALITHAFLEHDRKTTSTATILYESTEARDTVLASPMEHGVAISYEKLDELLASLS